MSNNLHKRLNNSLSKVKDKSIKNINEESTRIFQSKSTTLHLAQKVHHNLKSSSNCKYYGCCNSSTNKELTFQPQVHDLPYQVYPTNWMGMQRSKRQQWQMLTRNTRIKNLERTQAKLRQENKLKQCTFYPKISQFQPTTQRDISIYDKLYQEAQLKNRLLTQLQNKKIQKQRKEMESYQNKPNPDRWKCLNKQKFDLQPLYKRLQKVIEEKKKNKKMVAQKEQVNYPFQPAVNQNSKKIVKDKGLLQNVVDRLIQEHLISENRKKQLRDKLDLSFKKEFTFTPTINHYFPCEQTKRIPREQKQNPQNTFTPQINPLSSLMMQDRLNQTNEQKIYRIYNASIIKRADKIAKIQAQVYADCCFNPSINEISKQITSSGHKHHLCEVKHPQSPTHRPQINQASRLMSQSKRAKSLDNIKKKVQKKEEDYKKQVQYLAMKECSFNPRIIDNKNERKTIQSKMIIQEVAGFKQFYSNKKKAQEKEYERRKIQEKLFHLEKKYDERMQKINKNIRQINVDMPKQNQRQK